MTAQRLLGRAAALVALAVLATSGCMTVPGEQAVVPGITEAQAEEVLADFTEKSNKANTELDTELNARIETGVVGDIDKATLKARKAANPNGLPGYQPLVLSDTRFLIPELRGWPKWFVADTANNRDANRWLLAFTRDSTAEDWRASYLLIVTPERLPELRFQPDGHVEAVPQNASDVAVPPGRLSRQYAAYLENGRPQLFAGGPQTSELRKVRQKEKKTPKYVTQYADEPAPKPGYEAFALRTADGGALVMFATRHSWKVTAATGLPVPDPGAHTKALMSGTPKRSLTRVGMAEQLALVPARGGTGKVQILSRIMGIVSARGE